MKILNRILEINNKWKRKYNKLCIKYEELASREIDKLEKVNDILLKNIQYRDLIEQQKEEIKTYRKSLVDLKVVIKMIKIKINDKNDYVSIKQKYNNYTALEGIILLDTAIDMLREDFELSNDEIWELLKDYRANMKEVD